MPPKTAWWVSLESEDRWPHSGCLWRKKTVTGKAHGVLTIHVSRVQLLNMDENVGTPWSRHSKFNVYFVWIMNVRNNYFRKGTQWIPCHAQIQTKTEDLRGVEDFTESVLPQAKCMTASNKPIWVHVCSISNVFKATPPHQLLCLIRLSPSLKARCPNPSPLLPTSNDINKIPIPSWR